ncbi:unnamed protein product [Rhizoctonia solani]|uniref:NB-ARC domain-containing protein n=1 Tax=Rhizoctonia solani TaxID=456999 RepID=A0A8H3DW94_9AGAM|nr:unnamed protein product [Rhizoctonia solani]
MVRQTTGNEAEMMSNGQGSEACKTVVFAMAKHNLNAGLPVLFRSYSVSTNPGPDCTICDALYATMAHPDLFKSIDITHFGVSQSFVGGEIGCNNPLAHVLAEVQRLYPDRDVGCIVSIGAGHARTIQVPDPSPWSRTQDVVVTRDMAMDSERVAEEVAVRFKGRSGVYFRFNVDQGMQNMDSGSWERLGEAAQHTQAYLRKADTNHKLDEMIRASAESRGAVSTTQAAGQVSAIVEVINRPTDFKRCPAPTIFYTGREHENTQVIGCITGGRRERRVCVVYGLGGVGKTQLVLKVIECTWDEWDHVIYIDASSNEAIEKSMKGFAEARGIGQSYQDVVSWMESCGERWLVVFDNADNHATSIRRYIPARGRGGSVLITTRLPDLAALAVGPGSVCHLSSMNPADGTALLIKIACSRNRCITDKDKEAAEELVKEFGYLALAIVHAGAYIAHSPSITIADYLSRFPAQRQHMLERYKHLPDIAKLDERGDTVYTTWRMCYDQLKPEPRELLWLIAYLHYNGITEEIFKRAAQNMDSRQYPLPPNDQEAQAQARVKKSLSGFMGPDGSWDSMKFDEVMADLSGYSLINYDRMNLAYHVHVLVHDWAKTAVPHSTELAVECTATLLSLSIDWKKDTISLAFKRQLGLHITSMITGNSALGANHCQYFAQVYYCTGQWLHKAKLEEKVVEVFQRELGENDVQTWLAVHEFALCYSELGQWDKAVDLQTQVVDAHRKILGEEHSSTLSSMNNLACTYSHLGRYDEAQQLEAQVVEVRKRVQGEEHPRTLSSMNNLACTYSDLGQYDKAQQLEAQVFDIRKRVLGEEHPDTLTSMSNLALTYSRLGQYDEAQQLGKQVADVRKHVQGEEHPDTLTSMSNLASTYSDLGQYDEAQQLGKQVADLRKRVLGEEHPSTLTSMSNLALNYLHLGRYDEAQQLGVQVVDICKRMQGEEHPDTLTSMNNLALTYSHLGRYDEAKQLGAQVFDVRKHVLGEEHPDTLISMNNLATYYFSLGQWEQAEELYHVFLSIAERILGNSHPHTQLYRRNLELIQANRSKTGNTIQLD